MSFKADQDVFTIRGTLARYVCVVPGGHLVRPVVAQDEGDELQDEDEADEVSLGQPRFEEMIFARPPREQKDAELAVLDAQLSEKRGELQKLREVLRMEMSADRSRALKAHQGAEFIADWLLGKPLWFAVERYESFEVRSSKGREHTYLEISKNREGELRWLLCNEHGADGQIRSMHASEEEACAAVREYYAGKLRGFLPDLPHVSDRLLQAVQNSAQWNVPIPEKMAQAVEARRAKLKAEAIAAAEKAAQDAQQKLAALRGAA